LGALAPADPPADRKMIDVVKNVANQLPSVHKGDEESFGAKVEQIAKRTVTSAFEKGGEYLLEGLAGLFV